MSALPRTPEGVWEEAYTHCMSQGPAVLDQMNYYRNMPPPSQVYDEYFLSELAWCVYNGGMRESVVAAKWSEIARAFLWFQPHLILSNKEACLEAALKVFNHRGKAEAVIAAAKRVQDRSPIGRWLAGMTEADVLAFLERYPYIGPITKYHLAKNLGFDVVKPDRHLVRLADHLGYESPDALVAEIASLTGQRKGLIDYVLWRWLADRGSKDLEKAEGDKP